MWQQSVAWAERKTMRREGKSSNLCSGHNDHPNRPVNGGCGAPRARSPVLHLPRQFQSCAVLRSLGALYPQSPRSLQGHSTRKREVALA